MSSSLAASSKRELLSQKKQINKVLEATNSLILTKLLQTLSKQLSAVMTEATQNNPTDSAQLPKVLLFNGQGYDPAADLVFLSASPHLKSISKTLLAILNFIAVQLFPPSSTDPALPKVSLESLAVDSAPTPSELAYPLTTICQLLAFIKFCVSRGISPLKMAQEVTCGIGHSSGVLGALLVSAMGTDPSLDNFMKTLVKILSIALCIGVYSMRNLRALANSLGSAYEGHEYTMLAVTGWSKEVLDTFLSEFEHKTLQIGLHSAKDSYIVVGLPQELLQLRNYFKKLATNRPRTGFVKIRGLYHHDLNRKVLDQVLNKLESVGRGKWTEKFSFSVPDTENGSDLSEAKLSPLALMRKIVAMQVCEVQDYPGVLQTAFKSVNLESLNKVTLLDLGPADFVGSSLISILKSSEAESLCPKHADKVQVLSCLGKIRTKRSLDRRIIGVDYITKS